MPAPPEGGTPTIGLAAGLFVLTSAVFWQVHAFEYVNLDDGYYVTENPYVKSGLSFENTAWAFTSGASANWHPLTWLSLMLDVQLFGPRPGPMHLINALWHIANVLLLFLAVRALTGTVWRSAFVAALFAVHPLHVESVAWVSERKDVLSTFFGLASIWCYARFARNQNRKWYLATAGTLTLSLLAKQMFVTLPFVFLLFDCWPLARLRGPDWRGSIRRLVAEKIPLLAISAVFSIVAFVVQRLGGAVQKLQIYSLATRFENAVVVYVLYLWKMIWPQNLAAYYPHPGSGIALGQVSLALLVLAAISAVAVAWRRRRPYLLVGWCVYLGTLVPVIGLVQIGHQQMADRYTYLPLVGIFIALTWLVADLLAAASRKRFLAPVAAAGLVAILAALAWRQTAYWHDSERLFLHTIASTGGNAFAENGLGHVLLVQGRIEEARSHLQRALEVEPRSVAALNNLGQLSFAKERFDDAVAYCRRALEIEPKNTVTHDFLGTVLFRMGRVDDGIEEFRESIRIDRLDVPAHMNLGNIFRSSGRLEESLESFRTAARIDRRSPAARISVGTVLFDLGRTDEAEANYRAALKLAPDDAEAHANLGIALHKQERLEEALHEFEQAHRLDPGNAVARQNFCAELVNVGTQLASRGKVDWAIRNFREALRLDSELFQANYELAYALFRQGKLEESAELFSKTLALNPDFAEAHFEYGLVLAEMGQRERAIAQLREALRLQPALEGAQQALRQLSETKE